MNITFKIKEKKLDEVKNIIKKIEEITESISSVTVCVEIEC